MKNIWFALGMSSLLTGCTGMMYGSRSAPVNNQNIYQGNNVADVHRAPIQNNALFTPAVPTGITAQPVYRNNQPAQVTPYGQNPTLAQQAARPVQPTQPVQQSRPYTPPAQQARPYTPTQPAYAPPASNDGWAVAPNAGVYDQPKVNEVDARAQAQAQAQALRPSQNATTSVNNGGTIATTSESVYAQPAQVMQEPPAQTPPAQATTAPEQSQQVASAARPDTSANNAGESTAVGSLLKKASSAISKGDLDGAVAYLENAQRMEPQNSKILYDIANIRYHQGKHREAESFASRAVQVGGSNQILKKSWSLIASARKAMGDNQGAITAAEKATSL